MPEGQRIRENAVDLWAKNWKAYCFWKMAKVDTTNLLPRDLTTLSVLAEIEQVVRDYRDSSQQLLLMQLLLKRK